MKWLNGYRIRFMSIGFITALALGGHFHGAGISLAAVHTWAQKVDMPTARFLHSTSVVDGKIYVIGGSDSEPGYDPILAVEVYDPSMDSWTRKADLPTARMLHSASAVNGKIYVVGGYDTYDSGGVLLSAVQEYDPATDTWTQKADLPTPRAGLATSVVDGKIYAIGGFDGAQGVSTVELYDPVTDSWTRKAANFPFGVWCLCTAVVDGKIYALGGRYAQAIPYVQEYDPATDTWTRKSDIPVATGQMGAVVLGGKIFVIGGWLSSGNNPYTAMQMYDPETDIWTIESDAPFLRAAFSASVANNRIYAIGGTDRPHPCPATSTVYELTISGAPDLNGDGVVDIKDLLSLIKSWGQDDPLADIAPALGDGVVDVLDLEFLMGCWGQEIDDPALVAHWKLDESEGMTAYDGAGVNDGTVMGVPAWRPQGGKIDGALELNGTTFVVIGCALRPPIGPFSVLAWIKGGMPGQNILSQQIKADWLMADAQGALMTGLSATERGANTLTSKAIITDGNWHRIALTWDGASRRLYVDSALVAEDLQGSLVVSSDKLVLGASKTMTPGTFWSGLIDDVRIYSRAVRP